MGDKVTFGHYRVLQRDDGSLWELGSSATGVSYKALDTDLQRPVALKVINSDLLADEGNRSRFLREARTTAGLRHSNIASIYHLGKDEEQFFYATEFIEGQTVESYVARFGPMPVRAALHVAWQVSRALAAAARQQLVHGDIKPANIMIAADSEEGDWPFVKLLDFGLVRSVLPAQDPDGTTPPRSPGTAQSGSPEQIEEGKMDARSDVYSLGCTLWYLLTAEGPLAGSATSEFAQHRGNEVPWACRVWNLLRGEAPFSGSVTSTLMQPQPGSEPAWEKLKHFPRRIGHLLRRMLRKEPSQRPASALELHREIVELQREIEQCLADVERREALSARIALPLNIGRQWLNRAPWTRRAAIFGASALGLLLVAGYYWNDGSSPRSAPAMQTSGVALAHSNGSSAEILGWSYLDGWDEPFRSVALAPLLSFAEPVAADPGIVGAKSWLHAASIWDGPVALEDDSSSEDGVDRSSAAVASNAPSTVRERDRKKVAVTGSHGKKAAVRKASSRGKNEVKKTPKRYAYANYAKRPQRRVTTTTRNQGFNPLRVVQRARYHIRRVIHQVF